MTQLHQAGPSQRTTNMSEQQGDFFALPGMHVIDDFFDCPIDYSDPMGATLRVFVRRCMMTDTTTRDSKPLLYLQGGPGFECSATVPNNSGMLKVLFDKGYYVILLDQRGTGLSTPLDASTIAMQGNLDSQVQYCKQFRADSIVQDCERIRRALGITTWTLLGQSFGGFCILTYLSFFPSAVEHAIITGGVAPISEKLPDLVYYRLAKKIIRRNEMYYEKYSEDVGRVKQIIAYLDESNASDNGPLLSPNGGNLTSRRFRQIGIELGMHGGIDRIHNLVMKLTSDLVQFKFLTYKSRESLENLLHYDVNPIYAILHEAIYCQTDRPSNWSAERILKTFPEFNTARDSDKPVYFYGENIFSWMFDDYSQLRPLKALAERLAQETWTSLYARHTLSTNTVPLVASCYIMDMYVEIDFAIETLQNVACSKDLVTNRWLHNALRQAPEELLGYLFNLLRDVPS